MTTPLITLSKNQGDTHISFSNSAKKHGIQQLVQRLHSPMLELASLPATTSLTTVSSAHAGIAQPPQRNATYVLCVPKETQESGLEKLLPASRKRPTALVLLVRTFFIKASYMPPIMVSSPSQFPACQDSSPGSRDRSEALIQSSHCQPAGVEGGMRGWSSPGRLGSEGRGWRRFWPSTGLPPSTPA